MFEENNGIKLWRELRSFLQEILLTCAWIPKQTSFCFPVFSFCFSVAKQYKHSWKYTQNTIVDRSSNEGRALSFK